MPRALSKEEAKLTIELPLAVSPAAERVLLIRMDAARRLYNSLLGDILYRLDRMRSSKIWSNAKALPYQVGKGRKMVKNPARALAFRACEKSHGGFSEFLVSHPTAPATGSIPVSWA